jgi:Alpha/beta hydrolase family
MARIVGIHGIAQQYQSGPQRTDEWLLALRGGLEAAGFRPVADQLTAADLRVAFFGDLFRPPGSMAGEAAHYEEKDLGPAGEELLTVFYREAVAQNPAIGPPAGAMVGRVPVPVQVMLAGLLRWLAFAGVAKHLLIGNLKQVSDYLGDRGVREHVLDRVAAEVTGGTRVVIGHSLGSVVAYEYCCQRRPHGVKLLVTLGCPLGIPRLIFDRLDPAPVDGRGAWPVPALRWVNVADAKDVVALHKQLEPLFGPSPAGAAVVDRLANNGNQPHEASRYLNSRQTGEAVGASLGGP